MSKIKYWNGTSWKEVNDVSDTFAATFQAQLNQVKSAVAGKQNKLVSGVNIKKINNGSVLGNGNIDLQEPLVSGTNIKTINGQSVLGSGNISISPDGIYKCTTSSTFSDMYDAYTHNKLPVLDISGEKYYPVDISPAAIQFACVIEDSSGVQIKTAVCNTNNVWGYGANNYYQTKLVSGTNIKTINNTSILGSGDITIDAEQFEEVTYGTTTATQIADILANKKFPYIVHFSSDGKIIYHYIGIDPYGLKYLFGNINGFNQQTIVSCTIATSAWEYYDYYTVQEVENKVNSWQATPDNKHYPSEKLTKDSLDGKLDTTGIAYNTKAIPTGVVDNTSTSTAFTATIPEITELRDGVCMLLKNGVVTSAAGFTININNLGAKPVYTNMAAATAETTKFNIAYTLMFVYDSTRVTGGCWICYNGYDSNTNTIGYQLRTNSTVKKTATALGRYRILFTSADNEKWVPATASTSTNATSSRTVTTEKIDPFGDIRYYSSTTVYNANDSVAATVVWSQYVLTVGYSFNRTGAALVLSYPKPFYVKCAPQSDGSAIIDPDNPYVTALPSTEDGKIYIYLGMTYSATQIELVPEHPVYYYKGGKILEWTGEDVQSKLVSGTNIKTINSTSLLGSGDISIQGIPSGGNAGQVLAKNSATDYDVHWINQATLYPSGYSTTSGATQNKVINCSLWTATANTYLHILIAQANSYAGEVRFNVNSTGNVPVYINGTISSASNYTIPAGSYIVFYDGTFFYLRTDGKLTANITGTADGSSGSTLVSEQVTLLAANWTSGGGVYTQSVTTTNDPDGAIVWVSPSGDPSAYASAGIYCSAQGSYSLTFTASSQPSTDLTVNIVRG